ncbi:MAG TPA: SOS response-associated peptidase family protein [Gammaproteobacteria bacterium]|nr:SOS response-associated peptidase family protein [Xanthomonadales bacterium]HOP21852.1 SOS response-associated peptidase family protein [Gammaproteobacteria bacterium]HPI96112.1 SOS response-associated peptidase family protein [Gammaproteobacteria bacterium]
MCGAFAAISDFKVKNLTLKLGVEDIESRGIRVPASNIQIVYEHVERGRNLIDAKWWLMLEESGMPNYKYATFNSRSDKLYSSRLTKGPFQKSRCIIPASGFIEGQNKKYHYLENPDNAMALGGICKHYKINDEFITTASIITCPGNPKLKNIHEKSIPLMLNHDDTDLINMWLSPKITDSEIFSALLTNKLNVDLRVTPIKAARDLTTKGNAFFISRQH